MRRLISVFKKRKWLTACCLCLLTLSLYPTFVLCYTWSYVMKSDLEGGRHGPLDAYRHSLASAVVSYTIGSWAVEVVNVVGESGGKKSNAMDKHNNCIGAEIGASVGSFSEIEPAILNAVAQGREQATCADQITWLECEKWKVGRFW